MGLSRTKIVDSGEVVAGVDDLVNSLQVIDVLHHEIHEGHGYSVGNAFFAVANGATAAVTLKVSGCSPHVQLNVAGGGDCVAHLFQSPSASAGGTIITPVNRNRYSSESSLVVARHAPTITNWAGVTLGVSFVPGGQKNFAVGGTMGQRDEWILKSGVTYAIAVRNIAGSAKNIFIEAIWYEET